jgi:hypothetical protein
MFSVAEDGNHLAPPKDALLRRRVQGSTRDRRLLCVVQSWPLLCGLFGAFCSWSLFDKSAHQENKSRNLNPGVLQIAPKKKIGTKAGNPGGPEFNFWSAGPLLLHHIHPVLPDRCRDSVSN